MEANEGQALLSEPFLVKLSQVHKPDLRDAQWVKMLVTKPGGLSVTPRTNTVEGKNQLLHISL